MTERQSSAGRPPRPMTRRALLELATSPRIEALRREVEAETAGAVEAFWAEAAAAGTPLIEPINGDSRHCVVTFLWRGDAETAAVLVGANRLNDATVLAESFLTHIAGTDVWYRSYRLRDDWRASYQLAPLTQAVIEETQGPDWDRWIAFSRFGVADPLCKRSFPSRWTGAAPLSECSVVELPRAPEQRWWQQRPGVATGSVAETTFKSAALGNERRVSVYTPPAYASDGAAYPLLVLLDGDTTPSMAATFDNLIAAGAIPPIVAVMPDSIDNAIRARDLSCNPDFVSFLAGELIPWVSEHHHVSERADQTVIAGKSLGGLTAAFAAYSAPQRFGLVLSQSGSFWWKQGTEFDVEAEWLTRQFALSPKLPLRFYIEAGLNETFLLTANRHLRDVLDAQGYDLTYSEYNGGHDPVCWHGSFADGLVALLGQEVRLPLSR